MPNCAFAYRRRSECSGLGDVDESSGEFELELLPVRRQGVFPYLQPILSFSSSSESPPNLIERHGLVLDRHRFNSNPVFREEDVLHQSDTDLKKTFFDSSKGHYYIYVSWKFSSEILQISKAGLYTFDWRFMKLWILQRNLLNSSKIHAPPCANHRWEYRDWGWRWIGSTSSSAILYQLLEDEDLFTNTLQAVACFVQRRMRIAWLASFVCSTSKHSRICKGWILKKKSGYQS